MGRSCTTIVASNRRRSWTSSCISGRASAPHSARGSYGAKPRRSTSMPPVAYTVTDTIMRARACRCGLRSWTMLRPALSPPPRRCESTRGCCGCDRQLTGSRLIDAAPPLVVPECGPVPSRCLAYVRAIVNPFGVRRAPRIDSWRWGAAAAARVVDAVAAPERARRRPQQGLHALAHVGGGRDGAFDVQLAPCPPSHWSIRDELPRLVDWVRPADNVMWLNC